MSLSGASASIALLSSEGRVRESWTLGPGDPEYDRARRKLKADAPPYGQEIHIVSMGSWSGAFSPWGFGTELAAAP